MKNFAIIGSGISGLACANLLKRKNINPLIFEKKTETGGLINCVFEKGNLFHKVGGHVFNTKNLKVSKWFWNYFDKDKEFLKADRNAVIFLNNNFINYPIELNLNQLEDKTASKIVKELIHLSKTKVNKGIKKCDTFYEFLTNNFGETLCKNYFYEYNEKIWNKNLKLIPIEWLEEKLPMIDPEEILVKNITYSKVDNMVHSKFYYPKNNGSQFIVNRLSEGHEINHEEINEINYFKGKIKINNSDKLFDNVIYTGDVRILSKVLNSEIIKDLKIKNLLEEISLLDSNSTTTVLCECDKNPYSWVYIPNKKIKPHRIIMTGNFSPNNNDANFSKNKVSCTVEFSGKVTREDIIFELKKLPFNLKLIAYNYCNNSYIIQDKDTRLLIKNLKLKLSEKNIFLCGRFAEWEYFNLDAAIESAMELCNSF